MTDNVFKFRDGLMAFEKACKECGIEYEIKIKDHGVRGTITSKNFRVKKGEVNDG